MNVNDIVQKVLLGEKLPAVAKLEIDQEKEMQAMNSRVLQRLNMAKRIIIRFSQLQSNIISYYDFFAVLRDYILFCGRVQLPTKIADEVLRHGSDFGLVCEDEGYIRCELSKPDWFPNATFIQQVYNENAEYEKPIDRTSVGDAILYRHTGFSAYRSFEQKIAIHTAINMPSGYSLLVSLPTGAGKSLIGQILCAETKGLTVLVIPTTALGIDQEKGARMALRQSIDSSMIEAYCGTKAAKGLNDICNKIENNQIRLLITSPEALIKNNILRDCIEKSASSGFLKNLIIDEAHIVNDWGTLFRPDFQFLSVLRNKLYTLTKGILKTVLLSATLNDSSVEYLEKAFSCESKWLALRCDSLRTETRYMTDSARSNAELDEKAYHYVCTLPKPMLIYCLRPEEAENWKNFFLKKGFQNIFTFTGETDDSKRSSIIREWDADQMDIIIATSAFGMGVDKPDVRSVMHVALPESVNRFYQEVGRAGRDGLPCISMLCHNTTTEKSAVDHFVNSKVLTDKKIVGRWFTMYRDPKAERIANIISLDTNLPPTYFTDDEVRQSGLQNRDWNINVILFFVREGLLDFVDLKYDTADSRYLIKVRLLKTDVLSDIELLTNYIAPLRQHEFDASRQGLTTLREMERNKKQSCFSESFIKIFPLAEPCCGGCPQHSHPKYSSQRFLLHNIVQEGLATKNMKGSESVPDGWDQLLIIKRSDTHYSNSTTWKVVKCAQQLGVSIWITGAQPNQEYTRQFSGLILSMEEAEFLIHQHPSCLSNGAIITFCDSHAINNRLCKISEFIKSLNYPVAYYAKETMNLIQHGRPIIHMVNDIIDEDDLMEECNV